jgi:peptidoglycan L-alanyl-D-glutamate endopeptidase CwlK
MFRLSARSLKELEGVDPRLVAVTRRALELSAVDFAVHDGIRTVQQQRDLVAAGASQTMNSKHLTGRAVDLVPWVGGKLRWEWPPIYVVATAVRTAAQELAVPLVWGGAWDVWFDQTEEPTEDLVELYVQRRKARGLRAFIDGPHYELREVA